MLTPEQQAPGYVSAQLRPLLDQLYVALERAAAKTDDWFRDDDGGHATDAYFRAMWIRFLVREHLLGWCAELPMRDVDDAVEVRRPSNVGLHIMWQGRYQVRVRMGDERAVPVPTTAAAVGFFNQPLIGMEMPVLGLFVLWTMTPAGVVLHLACPHRGELGRKESLKVAWTVSVPHPVEVVTPDIVLVPAVAEEQDVPWLRDDVAEADTAEEPAP
jgi:hypothetical protein